MTTNKPEVKRYEPESGHDSVMRKVNWMQESEGGGYVRFDDYEALQAECEKLRKDAERYRWLKPHLYIVDTYSGKGISYEVGIDGAEVPDIDDVTEAIDAAMQGDKP